MTTLRKEESGSIKWVVKEHPDFFRDLDKLSMSDLEIFYKKKEKIKQNPLREKHLSGGENCYREPITKNIRMVYYLKDDTIWLLTIGRHDSAYEHYRNRLHSLQQKLRLL